MAQQPSSSANFQLIEKAHEDSVQTAFDRSEAIKPCPFGEYGTCCKICALGPCRIPPKQAESLRGICGADVNTIAARNFARMIAAGTAAHSDHGREVARTLIATAGGEFTGYEIPETPQAEYKLRLVAGVYGIPTENKSFTELAAEIGEHALAEFGQQEGELAFIKRAPAKRQAIWRELGIIPRGIDREVVELLHRTGMGTDQDYQNIMLQAARCALADGWGGSMITTELQDILFGTPKPVRGKVNLGVLKEDEINLVVHGHEPILSEMIVLAAQDPSLIELAKSKGAKGINLAGICCTANETLVRHGVPVAGCYSQQELAIVTGAVDAMVVDVQCIMQGLSSVAQCYHTDLITTSPKTKLPGGIHIELDEHQPLETAKEIVRHTIENFPNRGKVVIPDEVTDAVVGFSHESINYMLGGSFRASYSPLNQNIINGRILGVAGVVGCDRPYVREESVHSALVKELIANNVLVVQTGCSALGCAKEGLMTPEAAFEFAGKELAEVCEAVGIPPVLHSGACVDNSRILIALTEMVREGGLGDDISELPAAGCCPDWIHEKALAIGHYFVASGVYTVFGPSLQTTGAEAFSDFIYSGITETMQGSWAYAPTPGEMAGLMIDHINRRRKALGLEAQQERVLFDMAMRREIEV